MCMAYVSRVKRERLTTRLRSKPTALPLRMTEGSRSCAVALLCLHDLRAEAPLQTLACVLPERSVKEVLEACCC